VNRAVLIARLRAEHEGRSDSTDMKYRDIEYTVVQGLGRQLWKWRFALETGQAATKAEAVVEAERAIMSLIFRSISSVTSLISHSGG
jgi:hypothetical protein